MSLVVAMTRNRVIGRDNAMPWHLPADLRHFKSTTLGKPVLMGRKTFESIGKALPGRTNLVLTRDPRWSAPGAVVVGSIDAALARAAAENEELAVIGGAEIFKLLLPAATRVHLTRIHADIPGDTYFPELTSDEWRETESRHHAADDRNAYDMTFVTLDRVTALPGGLAVAP